MVKPEDIKAVLPCVFPNPDPIWMMLASCRRFGIEPKLFGLGETYAGWLDLKITKLLKVAQEVEAEGCTHLLYTDARDAWFCAGLDEIADKYNEMGAPDILLSAQRRRFAGGYKEWYDMVEWDEKQYCSYLGTPGQLASVGALQATLKWMAEQQAGYPDDDPAPWCHYISTFPGNVALDHDCRIFMNVGDMDSGEWDIRESRAYNKVSRQTPCVLHFNGGGSDWLKGKWDSLERHWRQFGYKEEPPWTQNK